MAPPIVIQLAAMGALVAAVAELLAPHLAAKVTITVVLGAVEVQVVKPTHPAVMPLLTPEVAAAEVAIIIAIIQVVMVDQVL